MRIYGLDPGSEKSGWVLLENERIVDSGVHSNSDVLGWVRAGQGADVLAIEMMRARGMPFSNEAMCTLVWVGRFQQAWRDPDAVQLIAREDVKLRICGTSAARDPNVRQALIDIYGPPGTKKNPGGTYGVTSHAWAALGVAHCARLAL